MVLPPREGGRGWWRQEVGRLVLYNNIPPLFHRSLFRPLAILADFLVNFFDLCTTSGADDSYVESVKMSLSCRR